MAMLPVVELRGAIPLGVGGGRATPAGRGDAGFGAMV